MGQVPYPGTDEFGERSTMMLATLRRTPAARCGLGWAFGPAGRGPEGERGRRIEPFRTLASPHSSLIQGVAPKLAL